MAKENPEITTASRDMRPAISKKRRFDEVDSTQYPSSASNKGEETETKKPAPKRRKTESEKTAQKPMRLSPKKCKGKREEHSEKELPPPLPPAEINIAVGNKVLQVQNFVQSTAEEATILDRDPQNRDLLFIPELNLLSAVMRTRLHYEIGPRHEASIDDIEEALVKRYKQDLGQTKDVDWVTIDISKTSRFEERILEKIARHGLDDVSLLEVELEMQKRDQLKTAGVIEDEEIGWCAKRFLRDFELIWDRVKSRESGVGSDLKEVGCQGVCPAPIQVT